MEIEIHKIQEMQIKADEFQKRDMLYFQYGGEHMKAIVKAVGKDGILFTAPEWLKSASHYLTYDDLRTRDLIKAGRYSRLRWFLKL